MNIGRINISLECTIERSFLMLIQSSEWLRLPKEERLLCIRLTVSENLERQRKRAYAKAMAKRMSDTTHLYSSIS